MHGAAMSDFKEKAAKLEKFKYPLLILALGLGLMLIPGKSDYTAADGMAENPLEPVLGCTQGVGRAEVIVSENGVVVVCDGAGDAKVRLDIIRAVSSYTGFGSDKITILKMTE